MNLKEILLKEHSRRVTDLAIQYVGSDSTRFRELMELFLGGDTKYDRRAAWVVSYVVNDHPELITPYLNKVIQMLKKTGLHAALLRNTYRFLQFLQLPEKYEADVADIAIMHIKDPKIAVAIKAFALTTLGNLIKKYPELGVEVEAIIIPQMEESTAAFKVRAEQVLKLIDRGRRRER